MQMTTWLYRYEAKDIQRWVLGTGKLRELAGASELLEGLPALARRLLPATEAKVHVAAAAGGTITFETREALVAFASRWPLQCALAFPGLTMVQGWVELPDGGTPTRDTWRALHGRLDACRQRPAKPLPQPGPLVARAPRSGGPAVARSTREKDRGVLLDITAAVQSEAYRDDARRDQLFTRAIPSEGSAWWPIENAEDFGEEYLAVVHADGNGLGEVFMQDRPLDEYRGLSEELKNCTRDAAQAAARALIANLDESWKKRNPRAIPLRPIVLGGDDYTVLLRARDALPFTEVFLRVFEDETRRRMGQFSGQRGFTASAGIAIVKPEFPFVQAHHLAEQLCAEAKAAHRTWKPMPGAIALHRVNTASLRTLAEIRSDELRGHGAHRSLWWGPWTTGENGTLRHLYKLCNAIGVSPRGSVREWLRLAVLDAERAEMHWSRGEEVYQEKRGRPHPISEAVAELRKIFSNASGAGPWITIAPDDVRTPLHDALLLHGISHGWSEPWYQPPSAQEGTR